MQCARVESHDIYNMKYDKTSHFGHNKILYCHSNSSISFPDKLSVCTCSSFHSSFTLIL